MEVGKKEEGEGSVGGEREGWTEGEKEKRRDIHGGK